MKTPHFPMDEKYYFYSFFLKQNYFKSNNYLSRKALGLKKIDVFHRKTEHFFNILIFNRYIVQVVQQKFT